MASQAVWKGYERASAERIARTICMVSGEVGSGKTRFGLTGPGPVFIQSLDKGLEGVVESILEDTPAKEIYYKEYNWNPTAEFTQQGAVEIRDETVADFLHGLEHARTIIWDKETDMRALFAYAEFGDPMAGNIKDWDKLNQRYFHLINKAKSTPGVNVIFIQSMKNEWLMEPGGVDQNTGKRKTKMQMTGKRIRAGYDRLDELVMAELHFVREAGEFKIQVGKCRQNSALQDQEFGGMTLPEFGTLLMPETSEQDWQ